jgi:Lrp/AsnC family transcriptional regulator for asnA, asnC and gidA
MVKDLEPLNKQLISILSEDGRMAVGKIAEHLSMTNPTVRSRIKNLIQSGVLRISSRINPANTKGITLALVGISLSEHYQLDKKLSQITSLKRVHWARENRASEPLSGEKIVYQQYKERRKERCQRCLN